ncbi:sensor domain-containing diguanylate cyclase [Bacillus sp. FJAT-45037]|uniref:sensor domain-containing diguanylate cyclase n=1 Tax=Bacillus sp. FJAT-45037 TaxID=2011007 RepID=UPI0022B80368|nr:diguanylate cyclase [Bacillus sp. FJAT-45037]
MLRLSCLYIFLEGWINISTSLKTLLSVIFAALIITITIILSLAIGQRSSEEVRNEIGSSLLEISFIMADKLDHYMWSRYGEVKILSELQEVREPENIDDTRNILNRLKETFPAFSWIGLTDHEGNVVASTNSILEGADISARPVFLEAQEEIFIGDVHEAVLLADLLPNPSGEEMKFVDISTPIYNDENEWTGVLAAHLSWEWAEEIEEVIMKPLQNRNQIELFIISSIDDTVLLGPKEDLGTALNLSSIERARAGKNNWVLERWPDGEEYLTGYVQASGYNDYPGLDWTILVRQPIDVAYAPIKELQQFIYILGITLALILAGIGWFVAGKITNPLKKITVAADRLRLGEKVEIPRHKGIKEIEVLSSSLSKLIDNLTQSESALTKMEGVARQDHLTGLPNRIALDFYLEKTIKDSDSITVLYMDLDGFKKVNDTLGHPAGDELLVEIAARLKQTIPQSEFVARMGGDEFVIILKPEYGSIEQATQIGERVIQAINEPFFINDEKATVGCSIGGCVWTMECDEINEAIRLADEALYNVKRTGKNRILFSE